ncbi:MAG: prephenate dehydrogenase [Desulfovibrionaceae bacterium]
MEHTRFPLTIVGHTGRMGQMLHTRLSAAGYAVRGVDLPLEATTLAHACADATVVLLCVPAAHLREVSFLVAPHLRADTILADITSVKVQPMEDMHRAWQGPVVGTHPLFGPAPQADAELPVVLTPGVRATQAHCALLQQMFQALGCRVFTSTAALHDEAMAAIQGLNFISSVAYFATLAHKNEYLPFLTPSFRRRQEAARKLLTEDAELFEGLFEANPFSHDMVRQYRSFLNVAAAGDLSLLSEHARWWWEDKKSAAISPDTQSEQVPRPYGDSQT